MHLRGLHALPHLLITLYGCDLVVHAETPAAEPIELKKRYTKPLRLHRFVELDTGLQR